MLTLGYLYVGHCLTLMDLWVSVVVNERNQRLKGNHDHRYVIEGVPSCRGMKHFVNSMAYNLMNGFALISDVIRNHGPDYVMHLLSAYLIKNTI